MARSVASRDADVDEAEIVAYYRRRLTGRAVFPWEGAAFAPVCLGPTWATDAGRWLLPDRSLGWGVLAWCGRWLRFGAEPWEFTSEQARFLLWWYAVDESGRFLFRDAVLQRVKGWGKDPLGACVCAVEAFGPVRVHDVVGRDVVGTDVDQAWVQTAAVALEQTKNTTRLFPALFGPEARARFRLQVGRELVHGLDDARLIQAVTSSPATLEGARSTAVLMNETHLWVASNAGHDMAAVIDRNAGKARDGAARVLRITNAYDPADDSVAQVDREAWEAMAAGDAVDVGLLYDSLEAHPDAPIDVDRVGDAVRTVRGDSIWLDPDEVARRVGDIRNPVSTSRRYWLNQIVAAEDAWCPVLDWDANRMPVVLANGEEITLAFDGSKSDDATALVACRVVDGAVFVIGCWQRPAHAVEWSVPRDDVDAAVETVFSRYRVRVFYADPSPGEDDSGQRYWDAHIDRWGAAYGRGLSVPAVAHGNDRHPVLFDMRGSAAKKRFTEACERTLDEIKSRQVPHDGDARLRDHVRNARRRPNKYGIGIGKEHRESKRKIDLAVAAVVARMARRDLLGGDGRTRRPGRVWGG